MRVTWTAPNGEQIILENPFILRSIEGTGGTEVDIQMQKAPFQDGMTLIDQLLEPRRMTLELMILASNHEEMQMRRRKLVQCFNPKLGKGKLRIERGGHTYEIEAIADSSPVFPEGGTRWYQSALIHLCSPDPFWYDPEGEEHVFTTLLGGWTLPFSLPIFFGGGGDRLVIENKGDVSTPVFIVFWGPVSRPEIWNLTTNKKIKVIINIGKNERLEINTAFGKKSVIHVDAKGNKTNAFHYISLDSTFWQLIPGKNRIFYKALGMKVEGVLTLSFYHRYVGI